MWKKNRHPFLGLKIVPEIIEEMNEKGQTLSILNKDSEEVISPKPLDGDLGGPRARSQASANKPFRRLRGTTSLPPEREAGREILDILVSKANSGSFTSHYYGSPPCRASNPLIHDAHFSQKRAMPSLINVSLKPQPLFGGGTTGKSSTSRGSKSIVRIEGFTTSNGESQQRILAFA